MNCGESFWFSAGSLTATTIASRNNDFLSNTAKAGSTSMSSIGLFWIYSNHLAWWRLFQLRHRFLKGDIRYRVRPKALSLIKQHLGNGDHLMVITATNSFIASEVVKLFGISDYIATEPEVINDRFTGNVSGTPAFGEGKYVRLLEWLDDKDYSLSDASFYSDSHHDIPLLQRVGNPVVVNPDSILKDHAAINGWVSLDLAMAMPGVADVKI